MAMRNYFKFFFLLFFLFSCTPSTKPIIEPTITNTKLPSKPTLVSFGKCIDSRLPTPDPVEVSIFPKISEQDHFLGNPNSQVTILVYSDFQCTSCAEVAPLLKLLVSKFSNDVHLVFRNFPLITIHNKAALAAQAGEAAANQGKFWEMHDFLFSSQTEWVNLNPVEFQQWLIKNTPSIGVNRQLFESDFSSQEIITTVNNAWVQGQKIKLPGTPLILINGEIIKWQPNLLDQLENYVKLAILSKKQFSSCPDVVINLTKKYTATLKTSKGDVLLRLFPDKSPITVNNFIFLVNNGWYQNNPFFRVVPGFIVQTGDPSGTGLGGPGYFIPNEKNSIIFDRAGLVGMVNSGPDSNGSQFFITLEPAAHLNNKYTIFGEVISGMDILTKITPSEQKNSNQKSGLDYLISINVEEK